MIKKQLIRNLIIIIVAVFGAFFLARILSTIRI